MILLIPVTPVPAWPDLVVSPTIDHVEVDRVWI